MTQVLISQEELLEIINQSLRETLPDLLPKAKKQKKEEPLGGDWLKVGDAASYLGLSVALIHAYAKLGFLTKHKVGKQQAVRLKKSELDESRIIIEGFKNVRGQ